MVRKGSPVRVRQRACGKGAGSGAFFVPEARMRAWLTVHEDARSVGTDRWESSHVRWVRRRQGRLGEPLPATPRRAASASSRPPGAAQSERGQPRRCCRASQVFKLSERGLLHIEPAPKEALTSTIALPLATNAWPDPTSRCARTATGKRNPNGTARLARRPAHPPGRGPVGAQRHDRAGCSWGRRYSGCVAQ